METWHTLEPFIPQEVLTSALAAERADVTQRTIINWCEAYGLGRIIGGRWRISRVALEMFLEGNERALSRYLDGDRKDAVVVGYFAKLNVPIKFDRSPLKGARERIVS